MFRRITTSEDDGDAVADCSQSTSILNVVYRLSLNKQFCTVGCNILRQDDGLGLLKNVSRSAFFVETKPQFEPREIPQKPLSCNIRAQFLPPVSDSCVHDRVNSAVGVVCKTQPNIEHLIRIDVLFVVAQCSALL